ncbi:LysR family transcriptional regulator [Nonomuraea monospora]
MHKGLRGIDANLLLPLHALLQERNLTHAGDRLTMSQSAMSGALTRLRKHFGDDLLTWTGRGFTLTPLGERLRPVVAEAIETADLLLGTPRSFDPAMSSKRFTLSMSEYAMTVLSEPLTRLLSERGPGCSVAFNSIPMTREQYEQQLMRRDLIIFPLHFALPGRTQPLFTDEFVCVVDRGNPHLRSGTLTLADLQEMPHAAAEFIPGDEPMLPVEAELLRNGIHRTVLVQVTSSLSLLHAVSGTTMCGFVPKRLARRCLGMLDLVIAETPLQPISITEVVHWHPRREEDPAGVWLRRLLHEVAVEVESETECGQASAGASHSA